MMDFEAALMQFVRDELLRKRPATIDAETYLFDEGMVDSLDILRLIAFIELRIGRSIDDREVVMEHFRTVRTIAERFGPARS